MEKAENSIQAGAVEICMNYRKELMPDQGLMIQVYGNIEGKDTEILRFASRAIIGLQSHPC